MQHVLNVGTLSVNAGAATETAVATTTTDIEKDLVEEVQYKLVVDFLAKLKMPENMVDDFLKKLELSDSSDEDFKAEYKISNFIQKPLDVSSITNYIYNLSLTEEPYDEDKHQIQLKAVTDQFELLAKKFVLGEEYRNAVLEDLLKEAMKLKADVKRSSHYQTLRRWLSTWKKEMRWEAFFPDKLPRFRTGLW